jgi:hypothetical protein
MPKMKEENFISSPPKSEPNCSELFFIPTSHSEFRIQNSLEGARRAPLHSAVRIFSEAENRRQWKKLVKAKITSFGHSFFAEADSGIRSLLSPTCAFP